MSPDKLVGQNRICHAGFTINRNFNTTLDRVLYNKQIMSEKLKTMTHIAE